MHFQPHETIFIDILVADFNPKPKLPLAIAIVKHKLAIISIGKADSLLLYDHSYHTMISLGYEHGRGKRYLCRLGEFETHGEGDCLFGVGGV